MAKRPIPPRVKAFVDRWIELFEVGDLAGLTAHEYPEFPESGPPGNNSTFLHGLARNGFRVGAAELRPYTTPKWSILRTSRFHPEPTWWCDLSFVDPTGKKLAAGKTVSAFLALAPHPTERGGFCSSYYVAIPKPPRRRPLDLEKESAAVESFLTREVRRFARRKDAREVQRLELHYSTDEGTLGLHFDLDPTAEPGRGEAMTHWAFAETRRPRWAETEDDATLERVGKMLVRVLQKLRNHGVLDALRPAPTGEMSVEEIEGRFGWPAYERRGPQSRLLRRAPRGLPPRAGTEPRRSSPGGARGSASS